MQAISRFEAFQGVTGRLVSLGLLHSLWIGLLVASLVALTFQVRPRLSHQARHQSLLAALLLVAAGPVLATLLHYNLAFRPTRKALPSEVITIISAWGKSLELPSTGDRKPIRTVIETNDKRVRLPLIINATISQMATAMHRYQPVLVTSWLIGMAVLGAVLTLGSRAVRQLCAEAQPAPAAILERVLRLARRAKLRKPPNVLVHPRLIEPCLCGLFRPVILLPKRWLECGDARLVDAILAHELAHARRLDQVVNLAQRLLEVAMFFSPSVHWLSRSLRRQREFCADALAVRLTRDPLALAGALESVARLRRSSLAGPAPGSALGGQTVSLLPRIQELLGMTPSRTSSRLWPFAALPGAGLIALLVTAAGLSQEEPAAGINSVQAESMLKSDTDGSPTKTKSQSGPGAKRPSSTTTQQTTGRQIGYRVQCFDLTTETGRGLMKDRPVPLERHDSTVSAWIVDSLEYDDLVGRLYPDHSRKIYDDVEQVAFENAMLNIKTWQPVSKSRPNERAEFIGSEVRIAGSSTADKVRLTVDLGVLPLEKIAASERPARPFDATIGADALQITINKPFHRISCEIPKGASVAISLALNQRDGEAAQPSSGTKSTGPPYVRPIANERLFLITPRSIPLKAEESPSQSIKGFFDSNPRAR